MREANPAIPVCDMAPEEKAVIVHKIHVSYPRIQEISQKMEYCQNFSKVAAEPECLFIYGPTGAGKTTVYKEYVKNYPKRASREGVSVPVLSAVIPTPATVKSLATKLLYELGDPMADRGSTSRQTIRLTKLIKDCGVEMIILDELQHFIDRDSQKVLKTVSDWLKTLIEDTGVPIVLIGLPEAEGVLKSNPQLSRRFANRHFLKPFRWDKPENRLEFRKFLYSVESKLPLAERSNLADEEMAARFFYASDGVVAYVMKLIRYGTHLSIRRNLEKLDLHVLADAFAQHVRADKINKQNPFEQEFFNIKVYTGGTSTTAGNKATNSRVKGKKKKGPRANDVLR